MENRKEIIEELNDILERNYDSVEGFRKAAENANDNRLMGYFNKQVLKRKDYIGDLTAEVRSLGGEPKESGTIEGTFHRAWIDFKSAVSFENDESVIEACITGEKKCIEEYNDLLEETHLPGSTRLLLNKQKMGVEASVRSLELKEDEYDID